MIIKNIKHNNIIFDLDGTIIDSSKSIISSLNFSLNSNNIKPKIELNSFLIGPPLKNTFIKLTGISSDRILNKLILDFKTHYDEYSYRDSSIYPGLLSAIKYQLMMKKNIYLATNKRKYPTIKILKHLNINKIFKKIYTIDMNISNFSEKKFMISSLIKNEKLDKSSTIYVGDRTEDGIASKFNKIDFLMVPWGYSENR